jgi:hypothetical protein
VAWCRHFQPLLRSLRSWARVPARILNSTKCRVDCLTTRRWASLEHIAIGEASWLESTASSDHARVARSGADNNPPRKVIRPGRQRLSAGFATDAVSRGLILDPWVGTCLLDSSGRSKMKGGDTSGADPPPTSSKRRLGSAAPAWTERERSRVGTFELEHKTVMAWTDVEHLTGTLTEREFARV